MRDTANDLYRAPSCRRLVWVSLSKFFTFLIPNSALVLFGLNTKEKQQAWREKFTLFYFYLLLSAIFYFWLEFVTTLFCEPPKLYDFRDVFSNSSELSAINGRVVHWEKHENQTEMTAFVNAHPHRDLSAMFPQFMLLQRDKGVSHYSNRYLDFCINKFNRSEEADNWLLHKVTHDTGYVYKDGVLTSCPLPHQRNETGSPCFYTEEDQSEFLKYHIKGELEFTPKAISHNFSLLPFQHHPGQGFVILDGYVLDVTDYITSVTNVVLVAQGAHSRSFAIDRMFLPLELTILLFINLGSDITDEFYQTIRYPTEFKECLLALFFHGVVPSQKYQGCSNINLALWITLGCFLLYIVLKINLAYLSRIPFIQRLLVSPSFQPPLGHWPYTILFIPFYAEPSETIRQTFDSLARTSYPDNRKLLLFVCDGLTQSKSDTKENYRAILDTLGYSSTKDPELRPYVSLGLGHRRLNYAKVYAGFYESGRNRVPFIMIVKVGSPQETLRGNRGKRDSMVIVLGFLERCLHLSYIAPLEFELYNQCYNLLGIDPRTLTYMLVTDADTQVQVDAVYKMVLRLEQNTTTLAVSGHVRPANPEENMVTMLQIIPNHLSYYSGMAYEACFHSVTSINSGFVMYRLLHQGKPVCISPTTLRGFATPRPSTMHMQNILLQGEDQYLGVVLLQSHPQHTLGFESEAIAYTALPTNLFALQGQQIREIRACFHIQIEFQRTARYLGWRYWFVGTTKLVDYILSMPLTVYLYSIYIRYFIYKNHAYAIVAECFAGLLFIHVFYFIVRRQFKYVFWFVVYCLLSVPLFMVWFPILAVWTSDGADRWYDVWPTAEKKRLRNRVHGIVDEDDEDGGKKSGTKEDEMDHREYQEDEKEGNQDKVLVQRMRLKEFEVLEAERQLQREKEEAAMLDAKFNGFDNFVSSSMHTRGTSWATSMDGIPLPPPAATVKRSSTVRSTQSAYSAAALSVRTSYSSAHSTKPDHLLHPNIVTTLPRSLSMKSAASNSPNPFSSSFLEDPFGAVDSTFVKRHARKHKSSKSQSSFFSRSSYNSENRSTIRTSMLSLSTEFPTISSTRMSSPVTPRNTWFETESRPSSSSASSVHSLTNSVISLEQQDTSDSTTPHRGDIPIHIISEDGSKIQRVFATSSEQVALGRNAPIHSNML